MIDGFKIYFERLREGAEERIHEEFSPGFLDVEEEELHCRAPVLVEGRAYRADDTLILEFTARTQCSMPCGVCNEDVAVDLVASNQRHLEDLRQHRAGVFDFSDVIRTALLLELPLHAECAGGSCPARKELETYLKPAKQAEKKDTEEGYFPFSNL